MCGDMHRKRCSEGSVRGVLKIVQTVWLGALQELQ